MRPLRSKSVLFDLYGAFVRDLGNWIAIAHLIRLMEALGVDEQAVRSSVSRFTRKGLLVREVRDGQVGYGLSGEAREILAEGDLRIYDRLDPARLEDGWALATFSIPEDARSERHQLRTRLTWLGYGNLGPGLWIAPHRILDRTLATVSALGLEQHVDVFAAHYEAFDDPTALVARCWDLQRLQEAYRSFVADVTPILEYWRRHETRRAPERAFADFVTVLHEWRKLPYLDPGLPPELLPDGWEGVTAADLFADLCAMLEDPATAYVRDTITAS